MDRQPRKFHKMYESAIHELLEQISKRSQRLSDREARIAELETSLQENTTQIQQIQHSIPMQLVNRYQKVVERLLPHGTRRRHYYEFMLTSIRVILNKGWHSLLKPTK